jgi:hypothetical protein
MGLALLLSDKRNIVITILIFTLAFVYFNSYEFNKYKKEVLEKNENEDGKFKLKHENKEKIENCVLKTRLADFDKLPIIILTSNPGSGNTWSRLLIESATGYYSGSVYNELTMFKNGFIGELEPPTSGRTVVVKSHSNSNSENADGIVMVIRNPYDSFKADFNRQMSSTHTGQVDQAIYNSTEWENFIKRKNSRAKKSSSFSSSSETLGVLSFLVSKIRKRSRNSNQNSLL